MSEGVVSTDPSFGIVNPCFLLQFKPVYKLVTKKTKEKTLQNLDNV